MYVKINRNYCGHHDAICERCLGRFLKNPYGYERRCFEELVEDGSDLLTLDITTGSEILTLKMDDEFRKILGDDGWIKIVG